ncbi:tyrosine--tRNA ligase 1, cytoplasmic [Tanacetum coccineum]|uniref:tyrosine--tRNA ligase n=1 Tax=Tanacetum coccineum TaxID=301880 RepID=A0ABQ5HPM2_9ASTR
MQTTYAGSVHIQSPSLGRTLGLFLDASAPSHGTENMYKLALRELSTLEQDSSDYNVFYSKHYGRIKLLYHGQEDIIRKKIQVLWETLTQEEQQGVMKTINVNKLTYAGCEVKIVVGDCFAKLNNKMDGDMKKIRVVGKYMIEIWKPAGMDLENVKFLWSSDEINKRAQEYWDLVSDIATKNSLARIMRWRHHLPSETSSAWNCKMSVVRFRSLEKPKEDEFLLELRIAAHNFCVLYTISLEVEEARTMAVEYKSSLSFFKMTDRQVLYVGIFQGIVDHNELSDELAYINLIPPGINEDNLDPEGDVHLVERLLYDNSSTCPLEELISTESFPLSHIPVEDVDPFMEEIDLFLACDESIPPGIDSNYSDSEGDNLFLERLLHDDPTPLSDIPSLTHVTFPFEDHHDLDFTCVV